METFRNIAGSLYIWGGMWFGLRLLHGYAMHSLDDVNAIGAQLWRIEANWYWRLLTGFFPHKGILIMPIAAAQITALPLLIIDATVGLAGWVSNTATLRILLLFGYVLLFSWIGSFTKRRWKAREENDDQNPAV